MFPLNHKVYNHRLYVPNVIVLKQIILDEYHKKLYACHPGYQKMIRTLRKNLFWPGMKKDVAKYLAKCIECQKVKVEHQHPAGLLNPFPILEWKWGVINGFYDSTTKDKVPT